MQEMAAEVSAALSQSDPNLVLSAAFKLRITQRDLATLQEGGWLNDEVSFCKEVMGGGKQIAGNSTNFFYFVLWHYLKTSLKKQTNWIKHAKMTGFRELHQLSSGCSEGYK